MGWPSRACIFQIYTSAGNRAYPPIRERGGLAPPGGVTEIVLRNDVSRQAPPLQSFTGRCYQITRNNVVGCGMR